MDCGLFFALSVIFSVPVFEPFVVGVKVTLMVHFPVVGASDVVLLQVVPLDAMAKLPLIERPENASVVVPVLVTVIVFAVLVVPVF